MKLYWIIIFLGWTICTYAQSMEEVCPLKVGADIPSVTIKDKQAKERKDLIDQMTKEELEKKENAIKETPNSPGPVNTEGVGDLKGIDVGFSIPDAPIEKVLDFAKENKIDLKGEKDDVKIRSLVSSWLTQTNKK